jgi:hypothetical protein
MMSSMSSDGRFFERYRGVFVRVGAIIAVVVAIVFAVRYLTGSGPEEKFRVTHAAGYSIIRPRDWEGGIIVTPSEDFIDSINLAPKTWKGLEPAMTVKRYRWPPDLEQLQSQGFQLREFQGQPAWMHQAQPRRHLIRTAVFQRGDSWFNLSVALPGLEGAKMEDYWRYMETFRTTRGASVPTMPTTSSATTQGS